MKLSIGYRDDFYIAGQFEGDNIIGSKYYVVAQAEDGSQWAHNRSFLSLRQVYDSDWGDYVFMHEKQQAVAAIEKLSLRIQQHLQAGGSIDMQHWYEIDPAYGSEAYQEMDSGGYFAFREKQEEGVYSPW